MALGSPTEKNIMSEQAFLSKRAIKKEKRITDDQMQMQMSYAHFKVVISIEIWYSILYSWSNP